MGVTFYTSVVKKLELQVRKYWHLIPTVVRVTAEKLVEELFAGEGLGGGGTNLFKTFIKVRYTLSGKISSGKRFRWRKLLSPSQYFVTFPRRNVFPQIYSIYLIWAESAINALFNIPLKLLNSIEHLWGK